MPRTRYLTTVGVARRIGVSPALVRRWVEQKVLLPDLTLPSGHRRYSPEQVDAFIATLREPQS